MKKLIAVLILCFILTLAFHYRLVIVNGPSMEPTYEDKQLLIMKKTKHIKPQQIVVFRQRDKELLKRVVAKEGEHLEIKDGRVIVNGKKMKEPYIKEKMGWGTEDIIIPKGCVYVLGDNRNISRDSRKLGPIKRDQITGVIVEGGK